MSIYLRYSPVPITLSRSFETPSSRDDNGDLKILAFPNQWGSQTTSFACSGFLSLAATSGIFLNTPGVVDASGIRANTVSAQNFSKINISGQKIDFYPGTSGALLYKKTSDSVATVNEFIFNTGLNKLTYTTGNVGSPFYVSAGTGTDVATATREITTFSPMTMRPERIIPVEGGQPVVIPASVVVSGAQFTTENIQIGFDGDSFKDTILTHQGQDKPAAWVKAGYLKADGALWNRFPKRGVRVENNRIIFYTEKQPWDIYNSTTDYANFDIDKIEEEFNRGDTIAIVNADTLEVFYVKPVVSIRFLGTTQDPETEVEEYVTSVTFREVLQENQEPETLPGYAMEVGPYDNLTEDQYTFFHAYAFSVTRGAYLTMQLEPNATEEFEFGAQPLVPETAGFKPSTLNTISVRPNIYTTFNSLAENIDFIVYGHKKLNRYDATLFDLDDNNVPIGLVAGLKLDANIPNAVIGTLASGVTFSQYLDRNKTIPSGYVVDETPKLSINRNNAYPISSITSGTNVLSHYASLSVSGVAYADQILTQDIYLTPKPNADGTGKYITNALLTVNSAGQIVSRQPSVNPTVPAPPTGISISVNGNNECSLRWQSGNDGGRQIVNYIVEFSANNGNTWSTVPSGQILRGNNTQTSCTVIDLQTSVSYLFRIKAQNSVGVGNSSEASEVFVPDYSLPQAPQNLSHYRTFGDSLSTIELSWSAPDSEGSGPISGYIIEESENNGSTWIYHNTIDSLITTNNEVIYGLNNENNYLYRVSAINASGQGTYNFIYASGNVAAPAIEEIEQAQAQEDVLTNWDFGVVLFTGVCQS